jgi:hypothetical protein
MIEEIKKRIEVLEAEMQEVEEWMEEDFNPSDASGGNFDDCYFMGVEHGQTEGELKALRKILKQLEDK